MATLRSSVYFGVASDINVSPLMLLPRIMCAMPVRASLKPGLRWPTRCTYGLQPARQISGRASFAYTWLTTTPEAISPDNILSACTSSSSTPRPSNLPPSVLLFLVTPRFAHWLDPSNPFLEACVRRLYPSASTPDSLYTVAAIVDKIPRHIPQSGRDPVPGEYEGISILAVAEDNVRGKAAPPRRIGAPPGEEPNMLFSIRDEQSPTGAAHEVGLRLANTVFVNGKETTLLGMRWTRPQTEAAGSSDHYILDQSVDLVGCVFEASSSRIHPNLDLPLDSVSQRRRVVTSMGNILRQVTKSTDGTSMDPMPASSELEKELPRYIDEHNIVDQRVSVWALVEKSNVEVSDQKLSAQDRVAESLRRGGKLHRVMSGGGGWGKKQGLLSLDPEVSFPGTARRGELVGVKELFEPNKGAPLDLPLSLDEIMGGDDLSHLSQVASEGDYTQFFVSVEPATSQGDAVNNQKLSDVTYCFGVVSDAEEMDPPNSGQEQSLISIENTFGALSEKAITYSQPVAQRDSVIDSSTKLDIPGSRVMLRPVE